jgi:hypothetical protein
MPLRFLGTKVMMINNNSASQLGNETASYSFSPVQVSGYNRLVTVAAVVNPDTVLKHNFDSPSVTASAGTDRGPVSHNTQSEVFITVSR